MPNLSPLNITRGMDVAAGVLDITGFVGAAKAVFRPLSHNAGGRRLQGTDASALLRQVLEEAQMFADVFVHGIGGAAYDSITDDIVRRLVGSDPPRHAVASGTLRLPLERVFPGID